MPLKSADKPAQLSIEALALAYMKDDDRFPLFVHSVGNSVRIAAARESVASEGRLKPTQLRRRKRILPNLGSLLPDYISDRFR